MTVTSRRAAASLVVLALIARVPVLAAEPETGGAAAAEAVESVQQFADENARLLERLRLLEASSISREELLRRNLTRLRAVAQDVQAQRQPMADFEGHVRWMSGSLSSYSKYIEAGSAAASLAKYLPIPYAGQAGVFAKFVAHFALSLNATSNAITNYLATSQQFVNRVNGIDASKPLDTKEIAELGRFADERLLADTADVQAKLTTISELSASTLAFLEAMNQYLGSAGEYWNKTKQFVTRKEPDPNDKSYLSEAAGGLRAQAASFNAKLRLFDEVARKEAPVVKSLGAFDELIRELDGRRIAKAP
ncbi:MAG: hypothetical protein HY900_31605 [Deltaproteobacteria bacterium]|nr:hypothetical protein [Deltaproteobacteria bacterium]